MDRVSVSLYCERLSAGFWAEPLNAVSNLAFLLAAAGAFYLWRKHSEGDKALFALIAIVALIAIGSFLFHTVPGPITVLLDVIPIQLFVLGYFALALRRFMHLGWRKVSAGLVLLLGASLLAPRLTSPGLLSGSLGYAPALIALAGIGGVLLLRARRAFRLAVGTAETDLATAEMDGRTAILLLSGAALFAISLGARTLDRPLCGLMPSGLHFIWHGLNGALLFVLLFAAIEHRRAAGVRRASS